MGELGYALLQKGEDTFLCICVSPGGTDDFTKEDRELLYQITEDWSELCECVWHCPDMDKTTVEGHIRTFQLTPSQAAKELLYVIEELGHLDLGCEELLGFD